MASRALGFVGLRFLWLRLGGGLGDPDATKAVCDYRFMPSIGLFSYFDLLLEPPLPVVWLIPEVFRLLFAGPLLDERDAYRERATTDCCLPSASAPAVLPAALFSRKVLLLV